MPVHGVDVHASSGSQRHVEVPSIRLQSIDAVGPSVFTDQQHGFSAGSNVHAQQRTRRLDGPAVGEHDGRRRSNGGSEGTQCRQSHGDEATHGRGAATCMKTSPVR